MGLAGGVALAATPNGGTYSAHDHETKGANWHVEIEINDDVTKARGVVLYDERCGETVATPRIRLAQPGPSLEAAGEFDPAAKGAGSGRWSVKGTFVNSHTVTGTWRIQTSKCDTGERTFEAHDATHGVHHEGTYADLDSATVKQRTAGRRIHNAVRRMAPRVDTVEEAAELNYKRLAKKWRRPALMHMRNRAAEDDKRILDPRKPEALVFFLPRKGDPLLVAFMFRVKAGKPPEETGPLLHWHRHVDTGTKKLGASQMSHVWLTQGLSSALADCLPSHELQRDVKGFVWDRGTHGQEHHKPCKPRREAPAKPEAQSPQPAAEQPADPQAPPAR